MVLIGQTLQAYKGLSTEYLIKFAKVIGIELCEINPAGTSLKNVEKIIANIGNMKTTFHLPILGIEGFDFGHEKRQKEINDIIKLINNYKEDLNLILGVFHPPEGTSNLEILAQNLQQLHIPVIIENTAYYSDEEFKNIYLKFKDNLGNQLTGWLFDVAHSYLRNGKNKFLQILDTMPFSELEEIHFSDCLEEEDSHYSFGAGILPINQIFTEIKKRNYEKILVNEIDAYPSIWSVIDSYQRVAKEFKKSLYYKVVIKKFFFRPFIQRKLHKAGLEI